MKNEANYPAVLILGSTGSVGEQAIDVARQTGAKVTGLCANSNAKRVEEQAREFGVRACAMADPAAADELKVLLADTDIKVYGGEEGILRMIEEDEAAEVAVQSIIGEAGLRPTLSVIESGKKLALANKESLVCAGEIVMKSAKEHHTEILPVDSEHSAIFQALRSGEKKEIKRILLTASGGPFYGYKKEELQKITVEKALAHPTWKMGAKITVDSATLMNKGFEVIEAVHLFDVRPEQVEVTVHRESIMHSAVEYIDNSVIAQMSVPDMRLCVQYALTHPRRVDAVIPQLNLFDVGKLTFAKPDMETFRLLPLAIEAVKTGGAVPAVVNAANEIAVAAFLHREIGFYDIFDLVTKCVDKLSHDAKNATTLDGIFTYDREARKLTSSLLH